MRCRADPTPPTSQRAPCMSLTHPVCRFSLSEFELLRMPDRCHSRRSVSGGEGKPHTCSSGNPLFRLRPPGMTPATSWPDVFRPSRLEWRCARPKRDHRHEAGDDERRSPFSRRSKQAGARIVLHESETAAAILGASVLLRMSAGRPDATTLPSATNAIWSATSATSSGV
jgi:hypothetical protein